MAYIENLIANIDEAFSAMGGVVAGKALKKISDGIIKAKTTFAEFIKYTGVTAVGLMGYQKGIELKNSNVKSFFIGVSAEGASGILHTVTGGALDGILNGDFAGFGETYDPPIALPEYYDTSMPTDMDLPVLDEDTPIIEKREVMDELTGAEPEYNTQLQVEQEPEDVEYEEVLVY